MNNGTLVFHLNDIQYSKIQTLESVNLFDLPTIIRNFDRVVLTDKENIRMMKNRYNPNLVGKILPISELNTFLV